MKKIISFLVISLLTFSNVNAGIEEKEEIINIDINENLLNCSKSDTEKQFYLQNEAIYNGNNYYVVFEGQDKKKGLIKNGKIIYKGDELIFDDFKFSENYESVAFIDAKLENKTFSSKLIKDGNVIDTSNHYSDFYKSLIFTKNGDLYYNKKGGLYKNGKLINNDIGGIGTLNGDYYSSKFNVPDIMSSLLDGKKNDYDNKTSFYINGELINHYEGKILGGDVKYINEDNYFFILKKENGKHSIVLNGEDLNKNFDKIGYLVGRDKHIDDFLYYADGKIYIGDKIVDDNLEYDPYGGAGQYGLGHYSKFVGNDYYVVGKNDNGYYMIKNGIVIEKNKDKIDKNIFKEKSAFKKYDKKIKDNYGNTLFSTDYIGGYEANIYGNNILIGVKDNLYACKYINGVENKNIEKEENEIKSNPKVDKLLSKIFTKIDKKGDLKAKKVYQGLVSRIDMLIEKNKNSKNKELLEYIKYKVEEKIK